jgi:hypothetical protein
MGLLSAWADRHFDTRKARNAFYADLGKALPPGDAGVVTRIHPDMAPEAVLAAARGRRED